MAQNALYDVKVLDLSTQIAGPYCTKLLADFGANVIKVEPPNGDPARSMGPFFHDDPNPEKSLLFLYLNTSKRSITLNLKTTLGKEIVKRLVEWADILVENFRPGEMASMGLGYEELSKINPKMVMVSITPFGQDGPYSNYKGEEIVEYALGGGMYFSGLPSREPIKHGANQAQYRAGVNAAIATMTALYHQQTTGEGQHVDVSIIECLAACIRETFSMYTYGGIIRKRTAEGGLFPILPTKDGYIIGGFNRVRDLEPLATVLEMPELNDPKYLSQGGLNQPSKELEERLANRYKELGKYEIFNAAQQGRIGFGVVQSPQDVVECTQLEERGYFTEIDHPVTGQLRYPGAPVKMHETPWASQRPAPLLGQHNREIFCEQLGFTPEELVKFRELEVI